METCHSIPELKTIVSRQLSGKLAKNQPYYHNAEIIKEMRSVIGYLTTKLELFDRQYRLKYVSPVQIQKLNNWVDIQSEKFLGI